MSGHPTPLAPGDNTPRIMRATGAVSHTGPSGQHPHHRGHEEGNGRLIALILLVTIVFPGFEIPLLLHVLLSVTRLL